MAGAAARVGLGNVFRYLLSEAIAAESAAIVDGSIASRGAAIGRAHQVATMNMSYAQSRAYFAWLDTQEARAITRPVYSGIIPAIVEDASGGGRVAAEWALKEEVVQEEKELARIMSRSTPEHRRWAMAIEERDNLADLEEEVKWPGPEEIQKNMGLAARQPGYDLALDWDVIAEDAREEEFARSLEEAGAEYATVTETAFSRVGFARMLARAGVSVNEMKAAMGRCVTNFGNNQMARAIFQRWTLNRVLGVAAVGAGGSGSGAAAYILASKPWERTREDMTFLEKTAPAQWWRDFKAGLGSSEGDFSLVDSLGKAAAAKEGVEYDKPFETGITMGDIGKKILEREIMEAQAQVEAEGGSAAKELRKYLGGSAAHIVAPYLPYGNSDIYVPKSSPIYPLSGRRTRPLPYGNIFDVRLPGALYNERPNDPNANKLQTSIPVPPSVSALYPPETLNAPIITTKKVVAPPPETELDKRIRAEKELARIISGVPRHQMRDMESLIPQNYDPTYVPSLPSNVTAVSSQEWKEYTPDKRPASAFLDSAPNVVGMGFDEQETQREITEIAMQNEIEAKEAEAALGAQELGKRVDYEKDNREENAKRAKVAEEKEEKKPSPPQVSKEQPAGANAVNAANASNPSFRNVGRVRTAFNSDTPVRESYLHP